MNAAILTRLTADDIEEIFLAVRDSYSCEDALASLRERYKCRPPCVERYPIIVRRAEEATGCKLGNSRSKSNSFIRSLVASRLAKEGYGLCEIGRAMGRDHSSVSGMVQKIRAMLSVPEAYKEEMRIYEKFESLCG